MSPKNKGTFGRGKPPITEPDEFITGVQSTAERLKPYVPHIIFGAATLLLVAIAAAIYSWIVDRRAEAATESFAEVVELSGTPVGLPGLSQDDSGPEFESTSERSEAALERLEAFRGEHGSARLAERATLLEGKLLLDLERYDEAREAYRAVVESDAAELLRTLAREGLGYSYEEEALAAEAAEEREQGLERALEAFEGLQPDEDGVMRAHAFYHQGRILAALDRKDEAIERLEEGRAATQGMGMGVGVRAEIDARLAQLDAPPPSPADDAAAEEGDVPGDDGDPAPAGDGARGSGEP